MGRLARESRLILILRSSPVSCHAQVAAACGSARAVTRPGDVSAAWFSVDVGVAIAIRLRFLGGNPFDLPKKVQIYETIIRKTPNIVIAFFKRLGL